MEPTRDISWDEAVQALRNTANRNNSTESKMSYRNINLEKYTSIGIGTSNNCVIWKRYPVPCVQLIYGLIKTLKGFSTVFEKLSGNSGKRSNIGQVCIALLILSAVIFTVLSLKIIFVGLALGLRPNCGMLVYANGSCVELPRPFGGTVSNQQTVSNHLPEPSARWCKTKPTPVPASRLLNPTKHSFFSAKAQVPYSLRCAQCNRVWGPGSRFRCNTIFNFSIKGKEGHGTGR